MKYLLHIDTSTDIGVVAVAADGQLVAVRQNEEQRNHAGTINLMIEEVLAEAKIKAVDLACVAVCAGPGSYTGLRIGMATAKGLCYALNIPLIADNRLTLLANQSYQQFGGTYSQYIELLTAREKEYFISVYNNNFICILHAQHILEADVSKFVATEGSSYIITDVAENEVSRLINGNITIDSDTKIHLKAWTAFAFKEYNCNETVNSFTAEPFYLKQVYTHK